MTGSLQCQGQRGHGDRQQHKATPVEAFDRQTGIGHQIPDGNEAHQRHRQVDEEDPVPAGILHQQAAQWRSHQRPHQTRHSHQIHGGHQLAARHQLEHSQTPYRQHHGPTHSLQHTGKNQLLQIGRERAAQRAGSEEGYRPEQSPAQTEPIGNPATGGQHDGHRQHIGHHH